ncbi:MAG: glycosyltransferase family 2 protein [Pseudomonadota bacterium]
MAAAETPQVVVVIPAWRAEATVGRAVRSALGQSVPVAVVVVDDASPDATADAARAADDASGRLTVLRQARNAGPAAARNRAIRESTAPWIALLDADDWMEPGRIEGLLAASEGWDMVADDLWRSVETAPEAITGRLLAASDFAPYSFDAAGFVTANLHGAHGTRGEAGFLKPLMRRAFLDGAGLAYDEGMRLGEDYDLYTRALARGARFRVVNPLGYVAVERAGSLSGRHGAAELAGLVAADRAILAGETLDAPARAAVGRHLAGVRRELAWLRLIDAVKARAPGKALASFAGPPDVAATLVARLAEQVWLRGRRRLGLEPRAE